MPPQTSIESFIARWAGSSAAERANYQMFLAAEERAGLIRWLRPEYQNPKGSTTQQALITETETAKPAAPAATAEKVAWPKPLKEQLQAVRAALAAQAAAATVEQVAKSFKGARVDRVAEILESLSALGQIREVEEGRYVV